MKTRESHWSTIGLLVAVLLTGVVPLRAQQTNYWTNPGADKWETASNWSLGTAPSTNDAFDNIFTGTTITIDSSTATNFSGTMTVNNLALGWPVTLNLSNAGTSLPLRILGNLDISYSSAPELLINNSALQVDGAMTLGNLPGDSGNFELDSGSASFGNITLGNQGNGDLFFNGGTLTVSGAMTFGGSANGSGYIGMSGGTLIHTNSSIAVGSQGTGVFSMSGGSVKALGFRLGSGAGSGGSMSMNGGTVSVSSNVVIGSSIVTNPCAVFISTNGTLTVSNGAHTAFVDIRGQGSTLTLDGGVLQADNLMLTNGGGFNYNSGTLKYTKPFQVDNGSSVTVSGGTLTTVQNFTLGTSSNSAGHLAVLNGGTLNISNATLGVGNNGTITNRGGLGIVTVSNGTLNASSITLGSTVFGSGSPGGSSSLTLEDGGAVNLVSNLTVVSSSLNSTSIVTVASSGTLSASNGMISVGVSGNGLMTIAGTVTAQKVQVGGTPGSASGFLYVMPGGKLTSPRISANAVLVGGEIDGSGGALYVAEGHAAAVFVTNGTIDNVSTIIVGYLGNYIGTLTNTAGSVQVSSSLVVGDCSNDNFAIGFVTLNEAVTDNGSVAASLYVTNSDHTAFLDVRNGTFTLNSGCLLVVDNLYVTNTCGHFINNGGTIVYNNPQIQRPVLDPNEDADGDGVSNGDELLAGTDPFDPTSVFQVLSATLSSQGVLVTWTTESGHSYVVQTSTDLLPGSFVDCSPVIDAPGSGPGTTNYLCSPNNGDAAFYRVRLWQP